MNSHGKKSLFYFKRIQQIKQVANETPRQNGTVIGAFPYEVTRITKLVVPLNYERYLRKGFQTDKLLVEVLSTIPVGILNTNGRHT
jgi:predicted urease superfamily metal-dependent hydrolase